MDGRRPSDRREKPTVLAGTTSGLLRRGDAQLHALTDGADQEEDLTGAGYCQTDDDCRCAADFLIPADPHVRGLRVGIAERDDRSTDDQQDDAPDEVARDPALRASMVHPCFLRARILRRNTVEPL